MSEVTKKSDTSSSQMRLLGGTPHIFIKFSKILARNKHVTLILTPHGPQRRKIQNIYYIFENVG